MTAPSLSPLPMLPTPGEIIAHLDRFVLGQVEAKRAIATAVYNHYMGLAVRDGIGGGGVATPFGPQHVLLLGPTGTGKSHLVRTIAKYLGVPFSFSSGTSLSQTGYVGTDTHEMVRNLYRRTGGDAYLAERGIIFVDEIDKIRRHPGTQGPDVAGEGAQIGLLTLLDGAPVPITTPGKIGPSGDLDTSRMLFICGGAFVGLEAIIADRLGAVRGSLGFVPPAQEEVPETSSLLSHLEVKDLVAFGLIPELIGRLTVWAPLSALGVDDLVHILKHQEDSILQRKIAFWKVHGIDLSFTENALRQVATLALAMGTGARALNRFVEQSLDDVDWRPIELMERGVRRIVIHAATVRRERGPEILESSQKTSPGALLDLRRRAFNPMSSSAPRTPSPDDTDALF